MSDELETGPSVADAMAHEMDELAALIERVPELATLSAEEFDRAAYELQMIEFAANDQTEHEGQQARDRDPDADVGH